MQLRHPARLAAACILALLPAAALADHGEPLSGPRVKALLAGSRLVGDAPDGRPYEIAYAADGGLQLVRQGTAPRPGRWAVGEDGTYCETLPLGDAAPARCGPVAFDTGLVVFGGEIVSTRSPAAGPAALRELAAPVHRIGADGIGERLGTVTIRRGPDGLVVAIEVAGLPPGAHSFHVHEKPSCAPALQDGVMVAGLDAGPHYDPDGAMQGEHAGHAQMHQQASQGGPLPRGDLPPFEADAQGRVAAEVVAPQLELFDLPGRSLMIHAYGDMPPRPDLPAGGGARIACGVIAP